MIELIFMISVSVYMVVNLVESKGLKKAILKLKEDHKLQTYLFEEYVKCNNDSRKDMRNEVDAQIDRMNNIATNVDLNLLSIGGKVSEVLNKKEGKCIKHT